MSRIDALVATQVAEVARPAQSGQERIQQVQAVQVQSLQSPTGPVSADDVRAAAAQVKQVVETASNRRLSFEMDEKSGAIYMVVRDVGSNEVIKQIPSEEILAMRERVDALIGVFLKTEA